MHVLYPCIKGGKERRNRRKSGWKEKQSGDVRAAKESLDEREDRTRPVTCGCHTLPVYRHFIIFLISITSHTSSSPFHLHIKVLQLLWARGKQKDIEGGGDCKDSDGEKNVADLRRNNALEAYIFIYPYMHLDAKVLLLAKYSESVWDPVEIGGGGVLKPEWVKSWQRATSLDSDGWSGCL